MRFRNLSRVVWMAAALAIFCFAPSAHAGKSKSREAPQPAGVSPAASSPQIPDLELITRLRRKNPRIKALIVSASEENWHKVRQTISVDALVCKPFSTEKLLMTVHSLLVKKTN